MKTIIKDKINSQKISLKKDENLNYILFLNKNSKVVPPRNAGNRLNHMGASCLKTKLNFDFKNQASKLTCMIFVIGEKNTEFDIEIILNHKAKNTKSILYVKNLLLNNSKINLKSKIIIDKNADFSESKIKHNNILLSDNAKVNTIPALEIHSNNSTATHAATIGKLDKEAIFYLLSRGLDKKSLKSILLSGFLKEYLRVLEDNNLKEKISKKIDFYLQKLTKNRDRYDKKILRRNERKYSQRDL